MQEGKTALIPKECEEILIAIVLDRPLAEAKRLVENPEGFFEEILEALEAHRNHPVLMQLLQEMATPAASSNANQPVRQQAAPPTQFQWITTCTQQSQPPWGTHGWLGIATVNRHSAIAREGRGGL